MKWSWAGCSTGNSEHSLCQSIWGGGGGEGGDEQAQRGMVEDCTAILTCSSDPIIVMSSSKLAWSN